MEGLSHIEENAAVSLFSSKFPDTLSTRLASCSAVLCLGLNPKCSSRINPRPVAWQRILRGGVSRAVCQSCLAELGVAKMIKAPCLSRVSKKRVRASKQPGSTLLEKSR